MLWHVRSFLSLSRQRIGRLAPPSSKLFVKDCFQDFSMGLAVYDVSGSQEPLLRVQQARELAVTIRPAHETVVTEKQVQIAMPPLITEAFPLLSDVLVI